MLYRKEHIAIQRRASNFIFSATVAILQLSALRRGSFRDLLQRSRSLFNIYVYGNGWLTTRYRLIPKFDTYT